MRRAIIGVLVLVGLLVAADFGAAALAESAVSRQMRQQIGLADDPSVRINGFPFLTQAVSGHYGSVDVDAQRIAVDRFTDLDVTAQLRDVDAPLSMLLGSGPKTLKVGEAEGSVTIQPKDLEKLLPGVQDLRVDSLDAKALQQAVTDGSDPSVAQLDPDSAARVSGSVQLLGQKLDASIIATLELDGSKVRIVPHDVRVGSGDTALPSALQRPLEKLFTVTIDPGTLPLQVTPTKIQGVDGSLRVSGNAHNLTLGATQTTSNAG